MQAKELTGYFSNRKELKLECCSWSPWKVVFAWFEFNRCQLSLTALGLNWQLPAGSCSLQAAASPSRDLATSRTCKAASLPHHMTPHLQSQQWHRAQQGYSSHLSKLQQNWFKVTGGNNVFDAYSPDSTKLIFLPMMASKWHWAFVNLTCD